MIAKGLVGHWSMNSEDTDNGKIRDRSAYDNHGSLTGTVNTGKSSIIGDSFDFTGQSGDYVEISNDGTLTSNQSSINFWIKGDLKETGNDFPSPVYNNGNFKFWGRSNDFGWRLDDPNSSTDIRQFAISQTNFSDWTMVTGILDIPNGQMKLYKNANLKSSADPSGFGDITNSNPLYFGRGNDPGPCQLSNVRVYNRALSQSEINQIYNKRTTVGGAVQGITAEVYDTQSYYNSNSHPSNKSGLDQFFDTTNTGVIFEKARVHNRPHIFFGNSSQNAGIGSVNSYPYYITTGDKDGYAWKIESSFVAPETGTYTFGVDSDDASDVLINGNMVASYYGGHGFSGGVSNHTGTVSLTQGNQYDFAARFEEGGGGDGIAVAWQKPSDSSLSKFPLDILTPIQT